jgi:hypothetical protein
MEVSSLIRNPFDIAVFNHHFSVRSSPGAGNDIVITAPVNARSELIAISFSLVTDANVSDRFVHLTITHGPYTIILGAHGLAHTASQTRAYVIGQHGAQISVASTDVHLIPITSAPILLEGDTIQTAVVGIQATDVISDAAYILKVWTFEQ